MGYREMILMRDEDKALEPFEYGKKIIDISVDLLVQFDRKLDKTLNVIFILKDGPN